jgi:hypothetical protein
MQHCCLRTLAFRLDTPALPNCAQVLLDGSPAELWQLAGRVSMEVRLGHDGQEVQLVLMPKAPKTQGQPDLWGDRYSLTKWEEGRFVSCTLEPMGLSSLESREEGAGGGALARPVKAFLSGGRVAWYSGELQGWEDDSASDEEGEDWAGVGHEEILGGELEGLYLPDSDVEARPGEGRER